MPRFLIEVSEPAFENLAERARQQRRPLKDQAAWLLEQQLLDGRESSGIVPPADTPVSWAADTPEVPAR